MKVTLAPGQVDISRPDLASLQLAVDRATERHRVAHDKAMAADKEEMDAKAALTEAQEKFDRGLALLRENAPHGTRWNPYKQEPAQ